MVTKEEALKLALEALESADWYINQLEMIVYSVDDDGTHENRAKVQATITAIKAALAQPAQEPVAWMNDKTPSGIFARHRDGAKNFGCDIPLFTYPPAAHPAQEPVATVTSKTGNLHITMSWWHEPALPIGTSLYTTPPQRPWVGLTDEELYEIVRAEGKVLKADAWEIVEKLQAKLKDKST